MKEQVIQAQIKDYLEVECKAYVVKVIQASKAGIPDLLVCYRGRFLAFEIKTHKTKSRVSQLQRYNIANIHKAGGQAFVVSSVAEVRQIISLIAP